MPQLAATIGEGDDAVGVAGSGAAVRWLPLPDEPAAAAAAARRARRKAGASTAPVLEQARVLAAAPDALRPYLESSYYGESGVDVEPHPGIELRFGDASQAAAKVEAAAAILADPSVTALDYVDLIAPEPARRYRRLRTRTSRRAP